MATITAKVSEKGGVSIMGLQRFPVTLYASQWQALLAVAPGILKFIEENKGKLATKEESQKAKGSHVLSS